MVDKDKLDKLVESFGKLSSEMPEGQKAMPIDGDPVNTRFLLQEIITALRGPEGKPSSRAKALAVTKLQEARFWLGEDAFGEKG